MLLGEGHPSDLRGEVAEFVSRADRGGRLGVAEEVLHLVHAGAAAEGLRVHYPRSGPSPLCAWRRLSDGDQVRSRGDSRISKSAVESSQRNDAGVGAESNAGVFPQ